jgi:exodeoxyribonuclease VII large subunit
MEYFLKDQANQFSNKVNRLNLLSPLNTLSRGYSISHDKDGKVLLSSKKINLGDLINSQLHDGKVTSKVLKKEDN